MPTPYVIDEGDPTTTQTLVTTGVDTVTITGRGSETRCEIINHDTTNILSYTWTADSSVATADLADPVSVDGDGSWRIPPGLPDLIVLPTPGYVKVKLKGSAGRYTVSLRS